MNTTAINFTDTIFATVKRAGVTVARHTLSGFTSVADVMRQLCIMMRGDGYGLVTVELRNGTLGWSERRTLCLR